MPVPPMPPRAGRRYRRTALTAVVVLAAPLALSACNGSAEAGPKLSLTAAIPKSVPKDTVLRVGDPATQVAVEQAGLEDELPFQVQWENVTGGPKTLQAFRAHALDIGSVADIPPLFAKWTGTDVREVAARETVDPLNHPVYELGIAPGVDVKSLSDLKGKKIAYSPGQAQGALVLKVLKEAGLTQDDVDLVEIESVDDVYVNALGSKQVDVAPLGQALVAPFLAKYQQDGGSTINPGVRDDSWTLYVPTEVLQDANKAAAIQQYTKVWGEAQQWINDHPDEFAKAYYVDTQGLSQEDADAIVKEQGQYDVPQNWDEFIKRQQETADLLAQEQNRDKLDVSALWDRRFEPDKAS